MPVCCSCEKAEAGLGRTAGLSACDCRVPARRADRGPAPGVELDPRARWQKELRAIALSRLVAPCPRDARATSAVAQMKLRMQSSMILARSLEPAHLYVEKEAPFAAISSSGLKGSVARRLYGSKYIETTNCDMYLSHFSSPPPLAASPMVLEALVPAVVL